MTDSLKLKSEFLNEISIKNSRYMKELESVSDEFLKRLKKEGVYCRLNYKILDPFICSSSGIQSLFMAEKSGLDLKSLYSLNSLKYRSDEFIKNHNGKHILFSGCSVTYGDSIPLEHTWTHKVYTKIKSETKTSGYFNLASPGNTILHIVSGIFTYMERYGIPDTLFILFPDIQRDKNVYGAAHAIYHQAEIIALSAYKLLNRILAQNGSKIFAYSWSRDSEKEDYYLRHAPAFIPHDHKELEKFVYQYELDNPDHEYKNLLIRAGDLAHPGIAEHAFYAEVMYNRYHEENN